jgi:hypothetical protein
MPLGKYIAEVMEILTSQPAATEICVENVKRLRFAAESGPYEALFNGLTTLCPRPPFKNQGTTRSHILMTPFRDSFRKADYSAGTRDLNWCGSISGNLNQVSNRQAIASNSRLL